MRRPLTIMVCIALALIASFAWFLFSSPMPKTPAAYFSSSLRKANITEDVTLSGARYRVERGAVTSEIGTPITEEVRLGALRLAYALSLARRSPVFDLAGTNPDVLDKKAQELAAVQQDIVAAQAREEDRRVLASLFPTDFVRDLARLEKARQRFLAEHSDMAEAEYDSYLDAAVAEGLRAADAYRTGAGAFYHDGFTMVIFDRAITSRALVAATDAIVRRMQEAKDEIGKRRSCLGGAIARCDPGNIALPVPPEVPKGKVDLAAGALDTASEIVRVKREARLGLHEPDTLLRYIVSATSACLSSRAGPYLFSSTPKAQAPSVKLFAFAGDLFFRKMDSYSDPFSSYFVRTYSASYLPVVPLNFYNCPETGAEHAHLFALSAIADFAANNPDIAPALRAPLLASPYTERDAVAYLRQALRGACDGKSPDPACSALLDLALAYRDNSGAYEAVVAEVVRINGWHASSARRGTPFDVSPRTLYLSQSGFYSLFLAGNPSFGTTTVALTSPEWNGALRVPQTIEAYSSLKQTVPESVLIHDIHSSLLLENAAGR